MPEIWEKQRGEPREAYRAFSYYRDYEPRLERSIDKAYHQSKYGDQRPLGIRDRAPVRWFRWCDKWNWRDRLLAYDIEQERKERAVKDAKRKELIERRVEYEFRAQGEIEQMATDLAGEIRKAMKLPRTSIDDHKTEEDPKTGKIITTDRKVQGVKLADLKAGLDAWNDLNSIAVNGHIKITKSMRVESEDGTPGTVKGGTQEMVLVMDEYPEDKTE